MNSQQCPRIKLNYVHRYALFTKKLGSTKSKIEDPCWPNSFRKEKKKNNKITEMQLKQM